MKKILKLIFDLIILEISFLVISIVFGSILYFVILIYSGSQEELFIMFNIKDFLNYQIALLVILNIANILINILFNVFSKIINIVSKKYKEKLDYNYEEYKPIFPNYSVAMNTFLSDKKRNCFSFQSIVATYHEVKDKNPNSLMKHQKYVIDNYEKLLSIDGEDLIYFVSLIKQDLEQYGLYKEGKLEKLYCKYFCMLDGKSGDLKSLMNALLYILIFCFIIATDFLGIFVVIAVFAYYKYCILKSYTDSGKEVKKQMKKIFLFFKESQNNPEVLNNKEYAPYLIIAGIKQSDNKYRKTPFCIGKVFFYCVCRLTLHYMELIITI